MLTNKDVVMSPTETSSSRMAPLGTIMAYDHPTYGMQWYRQGKPNANTVVGTAYSTNSTDFESCAVASADCNANVVVGIAQSVIPSGEYGWFLVRGNGLGLAHSGGFAASELLSVEGAAGAMDEDNASAESFIGRSNAAGSAGQTASCYFFIV